MSDQSQLLFTSESAEQDFKSEFNPEINGEWCELIKDIVAMANSGGGRILIGVNDDGTPSQFDVTKVLETDLAPVIDRLYKFTDIHFANIVIRPERFGSSTIAVIEVGGIRSPLCFNQAGNYAIPGGKQKCAFQQGTVYFRHGPKSEPATSEDLRRFIDKKNEEARAEILANLQKVVLAPPGAAVSIGVPVQGASVVGVHQQPVRLVDDPNAPATQLLDPNATHQFRLKEVVSEVNGRLAGTAHISTHDVLGVRRLHRTDQKRNYYYKPMNGSGQYSGAFIDWLANQIAADSNFLTSLRQKHHEWMLEQNAKRAPHSSRLQWPAEKRL
jgi:hypothetical protein